MSIRDSHLQYEHFNKQASSSIIVILFFVYDSNGEKKSLNQNGSFWSLIQNVCKWIVGIILVAATKQSWYNAFYIQIFRCQNHTNKLIIIIIYRSVCACSLLMYSYVICVYMCMCAWNGLIVFLLFCTRIFWKDIRISNSGKRA